MAAYLVLGSAPFLIGAKPAAAQTVTPGNDLAVVSNVIAAPTGSLTATATRTVSATNGSSVLNVTIREAVYREASGTLSFYYQVCNNAGSNTTVKRLTVQKFTGGTNLGYSVNDGAFGGAGFAAVTPGKTPTGADRDLDGVVGFNFRGPGLVNSIDVGQCSAIVAVITDQKVLTSGAASAIDGVSVNAGDLLAPTAGNVPEPGALMMILPGLLPAALAFRPRRKSKDESESEELVA